MFISALTVAALSSTAFALNNGVGKLPAMGYDTFNAFADVLDQALAMEKCGLAAAGYNIIILVDYYALKKRNASG
ncbi:hypothetical protein LTR73_005094 [Friedmanniomyces endolithicus]|nr:hypothetical protein LTR73_005094 [Friedmanniomyces endolithicus]